MNSQRGDIYLTRNIDSINSLKNKYWQHAAMSNGWAVIEGQQEPGKVIMVRESDFRKRNPERLLLRLKDAKVAEKMLSIMEEYIGSTYNLYSFNCVTPIRWAYWRVTGINPVWFYPDDIAKSNLFTKIEHFKNYEDWKQPEDWYEGRIV